jgi:hypothetical protein
MSAPTLGEDWQTRLRALQDGWDSYGSRPIAAAAIDTVESFAVVPCSGSGVQLEIHRDGFDVEIEIAADGRIKGVLLSKGKT